MVQCVHLLLLFEKLLKSTICVVLLLNKQVKATACFDELCVESGVVFFVIFGDQGGFAAV